MECAEGYDVGIDACLSIEGEPTVQCDGLRPITSCYVDVAQEREACDPSWQLAECISECMQRWHSDCDEAGDAFGTPWHWSNCPSLCEEG